MKQNIKISFTDKLYYVTILLFCFGTPLFMLAQFGFENKPKSILVIFICLYSLGIYSCFKIYKNSKSVFIYCNLTHAEIESFICKLGEEKHFKILPRFNSNIIRLYYKKYALGLDYEIHLFIDKNEIELNAFCYRLGIFDFGTRKRILKLVKDKIESNCASL